MKRILVLTLVAVLGAACGRSGGEAARITTDGPNPGGTGTDGTGGDTGNVPPPGDPTLPCNGLITLRLRGVSPGDATAFHLDAAAASLTVDGAPLPIHGAWTEPMDLLADQAWRLAIAPVPQGATSIRASISLAGGHAVAGGGEISFDGCNLPLTFTIDPSKVSPASCHAVVHLDLAGSIATMAGAGGSGTSFVPRFSVHY